jgi:competence protein ComEC
MTLSTFVSIINSLLPEPQAGLLNGILFGVKATLDPQMKIFLTNSGTLHIIALSGMNISILVSLVDLILLRFVRRPIANVATVAIIIGFIWFVGPSPSVIRAAIMGGISLLAVSLGRQNWPILAWILAVLVMLVLNPLWIGDLSFQLSIMATLGIILFGKKKSESKFKIITLLQDDLRITMAAQLFTVPIIVFQFHRISLVSPLSNILIGWLMEPIMILGFAMIIGGLFWLPLGLLLGWIVWVPLTYVVWVIEWTAKLPFASISF